MAPNPSTSPFSCWMQEKIVVPILWGLSSFFFLAAVWSGNTATARAQEWELLNGPVTLPDPLHVSFRDRRTTQIHSMTLTHPHLIGAGSGGAVFAFDQDNDENNNNNNKDVLLKVSWPTTSKTVQRECATLQLLEDAGVQASERCWAILPYPESHPDATLPPRSMIVVTPYMVDAVATIEDVPTESARLVAVDHVSRTLVQMLAAHIITIDVQPLISQSTGHTIFIDMTEAQVLSSSSSSSTSSLLDQTLIASFVSEMVTLIPEAYWKVAQTSIHDEWTHLAKEGGVRAHVAQVLQEQTPFF
jgi:hypothetical protein